MEIKARLSFYRNDPAKPIMANDYYSNDIDSLCAVIQEGLNAEPIKSYLKTPTLRQELRKVFNEDTI